MKKIFLSAWLLCASLWTYAQVPSPANFLGYELGSKFTPHHKVVDYFKAVASADAHMQLIHYGKTYEGRDLIIAVLSSKDNISKLENIKRNNQALTQFGSGQSPTSDQPAILWLSYNVHGNEASSTEAAMKTLYALTQPTEQVRAWLKNTVVIMDPSLNPDGRDRYVNNYNALVGRTPNPDPTSREHTEPWPGGRSNHYYFDLNRDWVWQSQIETQQRMKIYQEWMPQVHVDFHEQSYNDPYYFAPAAEPIHADVTSWQRKFQEVVGKNNARYFDEKGWQYFTKERFDLLYPAYGDTYPTYNGAIGMTYEQGGSGRAGLAVVTATGDVLTLKDRLAHHYTTGMSTLEMVSANSAKLLDEFKKFFQNPPDRKYNSYIIKAENIDRMRALTDLLDKNKIEYAFGGDHNVTALNYETKKQENIKVSRNDLVVHLRQSRATLANVLLEPETFVSDSNTYDITAWALPYAFALPGYATKEVIKGKYPQMEILKQNFQKVATPYAWVLGWKGVSDARVLMALHNEGIKVRVSDQSFKMNGHTFEPGALLIFRADNFDVLSSRPGLIEEIGQKHEKEFFQASSGFVESGKDFGSNVYKLLVPPKVAIASGTEVSSLALGEVWHFIEEELNYPYSIISTANLGNLDINTINVLILPSGRYTESTINQLTPWVQRGGRLILLEGAVGSVAGKKPYEVSNKVKVPVVSQPEASFYGQRQAEDFSNALPGAIFKVTLDPANPMNYGMGGHYFALKTDDSIYNMLTQGYNSGYLEAENHISGIAGSLVIKKLQDGMLFGYQSVGRGKVLYYGVNPLFRSMWHSGKLLIINGLFLVN